MEMGISYWRPSADQNRETRFSLAAFLDVVFLWKDNALERSTTNLWSRPITKPG